MISFLYAFIFYLFFFSFILILYIYIDIFSCVCDLLCWCVGWLLLSVFIEAQDRMGVWAWHGREPRAGVMQEVFFCLRFIFIRLHMQVIIYHFNTGNYHSFIFFLYLSYSNPFPLVSLHLFTNSIIFHTFHLLPFPSSPLYIFYVSSSSIHPTRSLPLISPL